MPSAQRGLARLRRRAVDLGFCSARIAYVQKRLRRLLPKEHLEGYMEDRTQTAASMDAIPTSELLKLENQLCFPLYACSRQVVRRYTPFLDKLGLTYTQYLVMMALWEYGEMSVGSLCERLYLDTGTLTPLLKKLEQKGLVTRTRSAHDARRVDVALTDAGSSMKEQARFVPLGMGECLDVSPEDAAELVRLLRKLLADNS